MSTTNCLQHFNYDPLPIELKNKIIKFVLEVHEKGIGMKALANIVPNEKNNVDTNTTDNNVFIYILHPTLTFQVQQYFSKYFNDHPTLSTTRGRGVLVQLINGPITGQDFNTIHPHTDPDTRPKTLMYILKSGGDNVKTTWYKLKDQLIDYTETADAADNTINVYDLPIYSNDMLDPIHEYVMKEDNWYLFNHSITHGVTNIASTRISLTLVLDYENVEKKAREIAGETDLVKLASEWATLDCLK